jgi:ribonuclease VapC
VIVVDTSAIMAILLKEPAGQACIDVLSDDDILISAGTLTETYLVVAARNQRPRFERLRRAVSLTVVPVDEDRAQRAANAHARWGKGHHPAKLNFGDCFAYELAMSFDCALLFVGNDFGQTDVRRAIDK